ncbi:TIGR03089 family protein [Aeromicrobium sp. IC_218]|uniref:TIGR03089 family protein n=1 Tax=Aeromicrobium sp. IC_218 TaxID=2545468 RepID=UPI00103966DC|nr:TIGR03089 family protein [Aeromicrobium sp. IC_218]TCI95894.1 TIGR03089 family protein [Aeromicrobium sp. IC_218]
MTTLTSLLARRREPGRPFVTFYDLGSGERVELSTVTTANWVAKTCGLLVDDLDVEPGTRVRIGLPTHWERVVWALACWQVGAVVVDTDAEVGVTGPDLDASEDVRVALSLRPLGLPFESAPAGFVDYNGVVAGHPDVFVPVDEPGEDDLALGLGGLVITHAALVAGAGADRARRLLVDADLAAECAAVVAAAAGDGSLVLVTGGTPADVERVAAQEHAEPVRP